MVRLQQEIDELKTAADNRRLEKKAEELRAQQRKSVAGVVGTGRVLTDVKEMLEHGEFTEWVATTCGRSHATTLRYRPRKNIAPCQKGNEMTLPMAARLVRLTCKTP
jgi:hypothetical protein